jgi:protocatechuate 3,4-dioxygenase beta subunit
MTRFHPRATAAIFLAAIVFSSTASGQPPRTTPPRDQRPAQTGTAVIRGRVFAGDTKRPLRRARIIVSAPELGADGRNTSTDADGRYEIADLPAGRYTLRVSRSGYLTLRYGQRRPLEPGKPLQLLDKQVVENVDFVLPRMSVINGRITDEFNDPIEGVSVYALRSMYFNGRRQLVPTGSGGMRTDDTGQFRLLGLAPGVYFVTASTRETWTVNRNGVKQVMGYAPTYFPGTTRVADARRVTLRLGEESGNIDFSLVAGRAATLSGTAFDSHGRPYSNVGVREEVRGDAFASFGTIASAIVASDGTFTIRNVPPGEFTLEAVSRRDSAEPDAALLPVVVDGVDIDNLSLTGSAGGTVIGQVITEDGAAPALPRLRISVTERTSGQPDPALLGAFRNPGSADVNADGTFTIKGVFGRSRLRLTLPDGWALKAVLHDGRDIAELPIELRSGETLSGVQVIVTKRMTSVTGQLVDEKGSPLTDGTVVVFAADSSRWAEDSRFVRSARPDQQGQWRIRGLPPGEYLAVAVESIEDGQWNEPEYLESIRRFGQKVTLVEAGEQTVALKLVTAGV